jgi:zinc/manganese transport system substrate-binding protein
MRRLVLPAAALLAHCAAAAAAPPASGPVRAIGVENQYADVIAQIGGPYVSVSAIIADPNTDPHSFEVSPAIAAQFAAAELVVENGLGYDDWADRMLAASPSPARRLINVQLLRGLPAATPNPHLWYDPATMPAVARAVAADLAALRPAQAGYFAANAAKFDASLQPWRAAIAAFRSEFPATPVAITEPVADDTLQALGADMATPFGLQAAIMNGTDPAPQDVSIQDDLLSRHRVKIFLYNQQVTDPLTQDFMALAKQNGVPVVGVYETMPAGFTYQGWMLAEVLALRRAVVDRTSTEVLIPGPK